MPASKTHECKEIVNFNQQVNGDLVHFCSPLFDSFNLNHFGFTKYYPDGSRVILETNKQWLEVYGESDFYEDPNRFNSLIHYMNSLPKQGYNYNIFTGKPEGPTHQKLYELGMWNSISFYKREGKAVEIFHMSTSATNSQIIALYTNQNPLLQQFILYFKEKLLPKIEPHIPHLSSAYQEEEGNTVYINTKLNESIINFLQKTKVKKYYLNCTYISHREMECLYYLAQGFPIKGVAKQLGLSPRSIETYLNHLKRKLNTTDKASLIRQFHEHFDLKVIGISLMKTPSTSPQDIKEKY